MRPKLDLMLFSGIFFFLDNACLRDSFVQMQSKFHISIFFFFCFPFLPFFINYYSFTKVSNSAISTSINNSRDYQRKQFFFVVVELKIVSARDGIINSVVVECFFFEKSKVLHFLCKYFARQYSFEIYRQIILAAGQIWRIYRVSIH